MRGRRCEDSSPGVRHPLAGGSAPDLPVGSLVVSKKTTGVCDAGEVGVVYEAYRLDDRAGWGIIFESGRHDGFSACEVDWFLTVTGKTCYELQGYVFDNVRRLVEDFEGGLFAPAFRLVSSSPAVGVPPSSSRWFGITPPPAAAPPSQGSE